jgi:hypothetical protein
LGETIRTSGTDNLGLYELKQHKLWFNEEYLDFLDHRKLAKMHCLQDPSSNNVDTLNNVRTSKRKIGKLKLRSLKQTVR